MIGIGTLTSFTVTFCLRILPQSVFHVSEAGKELFWRYRITRLLWLAKALLLPPTRGSTFILNPVSLHIVADGLDVLVPTPYHFVC